VPKLSLIGIGTL